MVRLARGSSRGVSAAVLMAAMLLNACTSWHAVTGSVPAAVETTQADVLRVVLRDGSVLYVRDAHISADSLMGTTARRAVVSSRATPVYVESIVKVPVTDVQSVSVSRVNTGRTILAVTGAIAVGFVLLAIIALSTMEIGFGSTY